MASNSSPPRVRRILIVDDHPLVRQGVSLVIGAESDMEVCAEAGTADEALARVEQTQPDLAIVDLNLKHSSGLDLIRALHQRWPDLPVLVLSMRDERFYAERSLRAGARGFVAKREAPGRLIGAIRTVLNGQVYASREVADRVLSALDGGDRAADPGVEALGDRELVVLELLGKGLATREIAERLQISPSTVDSHREHIKAKLGLSSAAELLRYAVEWVHNAS